MLRACHSDTCKPGVATQRPHLPGQLHRHARGRRRLLHVRRRGRAPAPRRLGARSLDEVIGRVDLLAQRTTGDPRIDGFDLAFAARAPGTTRTPRATSSSGSPCQGPVRARRPAAGRRLPARSGTATRSSSATPITQRRPLDRRRPVRRHRPRVRQPSRPGARPTCGSTAPAGQSFGAFLATGVELELVGEANDYVGKGMGGGRIVVRPPADDAIVARRPRLVHRARRQHLPLRRDRRRALRGRAVGERFAVRNSGAVAVVEARR